MLRSSFRAGITTLTIGASVGGTGLSSATDVEFLNRIAVITATRPRGSAATTAAVFAFTDRKLSGYPRAVVSYRNSGQGERTNGELVASECLVDHSGRDDSRGPPSILSRRHRHPRRRIFRSEERRVGKECRSRWARYH